MGKPGIRLLATPKPINRSSPKVAYVRSWISANVQSLVTNSRPLKSFSPYARNYSASLGVLPTPHWGVKLYCNISIIKLEWFDLEWPNLKWEHRWGRRRFRGHPHPHVKGRGTIVPKLCGTPTYARMVRPAMQFGVVIHVAD